jgi:hypothetical protein
MISTAIMSKNRGKSKLSKTVLFNANKHVFHCEKLLGTLFYGQPSYNPVAPCGGGLEYFIVVPASRKRRQKGNTVSDETVKYSYWALLP